MAGGFQSMEITGARQWSNFNNYGFFGPCPNFDPAMPTTFNDSLHASIYALPIAKTTVPAAMMGISTVRLLDNVFKTGGARDGRIPRHLQRSRERDPGGRSAADGSAPVR